MDSPKIFVKDLIDKKQFESVFLIKEKLDLKDKNGKPYISMMLADISGSIDGRIWDNVPAVSKKYESGQFALVKGHVQSYQNRLQVVIHSLSEATDVKFEDYLKTSEKPPQEMLEELLGVVENLKDESIKRLLLETLTRDDLKGLILKAPAAKTIHHAYVGGLLEHILSICKIMEFMAIQYPFLKKDYLIFGAIYHDIGKVWELSVGNSIQYTDRGRLIGHMQMACELLDTQCSRILGFPQEVKDHLKHIILSHHGKLEFGSPKRPKFLEALVVAMVDELDSRINCLHGFMGEELRGGHKWSRYNAMFDRYFLLDILGEQEANER